MKKLSIFLVAVALFVIPGLSEAAPFVICDEYTTSMSQPTSFSVTMDGGTAVSSTPQTLANGSVRLHYDLAGLAAGNHNMTVSACNVWGCSSATPFAFTKSVPGQPANIGLSNQ